jgi:hypothetical protein
MAIARASSSTLDIVGGNLTAIQEVHNRFTSVTLPLLHQCCTTTE